MTDRGSYDTPEAKMPTTRRIVTGHNAQGLSVFESDTTLSPVDPTTSDFSAPTGLIPGFTTIAKTSGFPDISVNAPFVDLHGRKMPLSDDSGVTCRIVDFPPVPAELRSKDGVNFMHRTQSVDFGIVIEGRIWCVLDSGDEREVGVGEVVVQRGTEHAWQNRSGENARMVFMLVPSVPIKNNATGGTHELTDTSHLED